MLPRMHDLDHEERLLGGTPELARGGAIDLEQIARHHSLRATPVEKQNLLGVREHMEIPLRDHVGLESVANRHGPHVARVLERLERHRQVAVMDPDELHDYVAEQLALLHFRKSGHFVSPTSRDPGNAHSYD